MLSSIGKAFGKALGTVVGAAAGLTITGWVSYGSLKLVEAAHIRKLNKEIEELEEDEE